MFARNQLFLHSEGYSFVSCMTFRSCKVKQSLNRLFFVVNRFGFLGSIDSNTGSPDLGWDTDQFPMDIKNCTLVMKVRLLKAVKYVPSNQSRCIELVESSDLGGHNGNDRDNDEIYYHVCKLQTLISTM